MEERTLSITIGSGDIRHNNRLFKPSNVDHSRTPDNITLAREDIQDAYHRLFNDSVTKYNESQKRNDRKIKNYFDKIYRLIRKSLSMNLSHRLEIKAISPTRRNA